MFFTLSGYLITGSLRRDLEETGRIRFGQFYLRLALRLLPAMTFTTNLPGVAGVLMVMALLPLREYAATYVLGAVLIGVLTAALCMSLTSSEETTGPAAATKALASLGVISYGAYLWNYPLSLWMGRRGWAGSIRAKIFTIIAAAGSYHLVEKPIQDRVRRRRAR